MIHPIILVRGRPKQFIHLLIATLLPLGLSALAQAVVNTQLVAYWDMENNCNSSINETMGTGLNFSVITKGTMVPGWNGISKGCYYSDGGYGETPKDQIRLSTNRSFTFIGFFNMTTNTNKAAFTMSATSESWGHLFAYENGAYQFYSTSNNAAYNIVSGGNIYSPLHIGWACFAITFNGTNYTTYINATNGWSNGSMTVSPYNYGVIGLARDQNGGAGNVAFDNLAFFNRSLSEAEIKDFCVNSTISAPVAVRSIAWADQVPPDLNTTNAKNFMNISYTLSSADNFLNATINFQVNRSNAAYKFINGTSISGYQGHNYSSLVGTRVSFVLDDNDVYPSSYPINPDIVDSTAHTAYSIASTSTAVLFRIKNVSTKDYGYLEFMANTSGLIPLDVWYCNSSYVSGQYSLSSACAQIGSLNATGTYDHFSGISGHQLLTFSVNGSGYVAGIKATPLSSFILASGGTWSAYYVSNISEPYQSQTSTNNGNAWTNLSGSFDAHLHQFNNYTDIFTYYACGTWSDGSACEAVVHYDAFNLSPLKPLPGIYVSPIGVILGNITINWTAGQALQDKTIKNYSVFSTNLTFGLNQTICYTNGSLFCNVDSTTIADGFYYFGVTTCDNNGLCAVDYSPLVTVNNNGFIKLLPLFVSALLKPENLRVGQSTYLNTTWYVNTSFNVLDSCYNIVVVDGVSVRRDGSFINTTCEDAVRSDIEGVMQWTSTCANSSGGNLSCVNLTFGAEYSYRGLGSIGNGLLLLGMLLFGAFLIVSGYLVQNLAVQVFGLVLVVIICINSAVPGSDIFALVCTGLVFVINMGRR